jgi:hypothetical protein
MDPSLNAGHAQRDGLLKSDTGTLIGYLGNHAALQLQYAALVRKHFRAPLLS